MDRAVLIHELLASAAAEAPNATAVRDSTDAWTYRELAEYAQAWNGWLAARGVGPGDRVLTQLSTTRELVAMFYGTTARGAVFVPINPAMKPYHLRAVLANAEPALVVTDAEHVANFHGLASMPVHDVADIWGEVAARPVAPAVSIRSDDVAALVYTSGSTAMPKAVVCPHAQVVFATRAIAATLGYRPDDVVLCRFPMSWDYGLYKVLLTCVARAEVVLAGGESDLRLLSRMRETGTTIVPVVPSLAKMIAALAIRDEAPAPPVRMFTNTGAALARSVTEALREHFPGAQVIRQFGQTECKRITIMMPGPDGERPDSVGLPLPGTTVLILDQRGDPLPPGSIGEIVVAGPHVMPGYWNATELTERTFVDAAAGLRLHTGDYGYLDDDGYLYFHGRRDDMFKRKGIRMSTIEIEAAAMDIRGVMAATAVPPSDSHDLALFVEGTLTPAEILRELRQRLEPAKIPAICRVLSELPLTQHGKNARDGFARMLSEPAR
ncbi:AMP-binding protein [Nocardia sp. NPDC050175]|uniref:AMP-binding protein n=1 Tax=Nocardia sp. NPDC050175 TaxID=3364317 RepID=UPI00379D038F